MFRARWCETIISLAQVIRASSGNINHLKSRPNELDEVDLIAPILATRARKDTFKAATASTIMKKDPFGNDVGYFMPFPTSGSKKSATANFPIKLYAIIENIENNYNAANRTLAILASTSSVSSPFQTAVSGQDQVIQPLPIHKPSSPVTKCIGWVNNGMAFQVYDEVELFNLLKIHFNRKIYDFSNIST